MAKQNFQLQYWGGSNDGPKGHRSSYEHIWTAAKHMADAVSARAHRAPESHVLLQDKSHTPPLVLAQWDGYDSETGHKVTFNTEALAAFDNDPFWRLTELMERDAQERAET